MMNEINKLVWPSPAGIGVLDNAAWDQTVEISLNTPNLEGATVITAAPPAEAYTIEYAVTANIVLESEGFNTTGDGFTPITVTLNEGGA